MAKIPKKTLIKILVSATLLTFIFVKIDKKQFVENVSKVNPAYVPAILGLIVANYVISSIRWRYLLTENKDKVSLTYLIRLYFEGSFFNNFMPTSIGGDVYKILKLKQKLNDTTVAFVSTFMERFTGVIALVIISSGALIKLLGVWGALIFFAAIFSIPAGYVFLGFVSKKVKKLQKIYNAITAYNKYPKVLLIALGTSFLVQLCSIATQYLVFLSIGGSFSFFYALFIFPIIILASFFIPSLNGMGVQDALYIQLIAQPTPNLTAALALSASIIYHLARLLVSLLGGLSYAINKE